MVSRKRANIKNVRVISQICCSSNFS